MGKQVKKILPDGKSSGLSLNQFKIYRNNNSKFNGLKGQDIYSIKLFKRKFFQEFPSFKEKPNFDILNFIERNYESDIKVKKIIDDLVEGLANIITSLYEANDKCIEYNENLFEADWEFWRKCKNIIFDGKIISGSLGNKFVELLQKKFEEELINIKVFKLSDFTDVDTPSLLGCSYGNNYKKQYVFDFGNTSVKRGLAKNDNGNIQIIELDPIFHKDFWTLPDCIESSIYIDNFISNVILKTIMEFDKKVETNINISLCIANNILNNQIADRGSYRFLRLLGNDYQKHLSEKISAKLKNKININIYNDAEAIGRIFSKFSPNTAIITLGTLLGIAYPQTKNIF